MNRLCAVTFLGCLALARNICGCAALHGNAAGVLTHGGQDPTPCAGITRVVCNFVTLSPSYPAEPPGRPMVRASGRSLILSRAASQCRGAVDRSYLNSKDFSSGVAKMSGFPG